MGDGERQRAQRGCILLSRPYYSKEVAFVYQQASAGYPPALPIKLTATGIHYKHRTGSYIALVWEGEKGRARKWITFQFEITNIHLLLISPFLI